MTEITTTSATPPLEHFEVPNYAVLQAFLLPPFQTKAGRFIVCLIKLSQQLLPDANIIRI